MSGIKYSSPETGKTLQVNWSNDLELDVPDLPNPFNHQNSLYSSEWFDGMLRFASDLRASDLHIEVKSHRLDLPDGGQGQPFEVATVRIRIDGFLRPFFTAMSPENDVVALSPLKSSLTMNRREVTKPLEGTHDFRLHGEQRTCRVVGLRTSLGGNDSGQVFIIRLPLVGGLRSLEELSFSDSNLALAHQLLGSASKLVILVGPMGSGKTTTAHGALKQVVDDGTRAVFSVEDPVERVIPGIAQMEIREGTGNTYESLTRALVRADYDTLFLGEIRDKGTAQTAVRQSKAGRQVISTLHADDNVSAVLRLIELSGDVRGSVLDSLGGIISQRLVAVRNPDWGGKTSSQRYHGRVPVHEVMVITESLSDLISDPNASPHEIRRLAERESGSSFRMDAQRLLRAGITDSKEIYRVLRMRPDEVFDDPEEAGQYPLD